MYAPWRSRDCVSSGKSCVYYTLVPMGDMFGFLGYLIQLVCVCVTWNPRECQVRGVDQCYSFQLSVAFKLCLPLSLIYVSQGRK